MTESLANLTVEMDGQAVGKLIFGRAGRYMPNAGISLAATS